jgi:hypothetical protein
MNDGIKRLFELGDDTSMTDDEAWDRVVQHFIAAVGAFCLGALVFLDLIILDIRWPKAMLASWIVIACVIGRLGVWTIRKTAVVLTLYAVAYLIGAAPAPAEIRVAISRFFLL